MLAMTFSLICAYRRLLNARLVGSPKGVKFPRVAAAIGVGVLQIERRIALCRVMPNVVVRAADGDAIVPIVVGNVVPHIIAVSDEQQQAIAICVVAGIVVTESVVIGAIHRETVLVIKGGGVPLEIVFG